MKWIMDWIHANPIWFAAIITALHHAFDAAVDSLPEPKPMSPAWYQFAYSFCQKFAGNYRTKGNSK